MDILRQERQMIRTAISEKFGTELVMICRKVNDQKAYSIWYAQVVCAKANQDQIVVCVVPLESWHMPGTQAHLQSLEWSNFQTRTTTDTDLLQALPSQSCPVRPSMTELSEQVLNTRFNRITKSTLSHTYLSSELPSLRVDLLVDKQLTTFSDKGSLKACMQTYQCSLEFQN